MTTTEEESVLRAECKLTVPALKRYIVDFLVHEQLLGQFLTWVDRRRAADKRVQVQMFLRSVQQPGLEERFNRVRNGYYASKFHGPG